MSDLRPIRWLHLSDFHFKAEERWDRRKTLTALLRHLKKLRKEGFEPDFVFITGDVAFSGKREEYDEAQRFFTELAETLDLEPREQFFIVPGNHDVDRSAIGAGDRRILKGVDSQGDVEDLFGDPETMKMKLLGRAWRISTPPPSASWALPAAGTAIGPGGWRRSSGSSRPGGVILKFLVYCDSSRWFPPQNQRQTMKKLEVDVPDQLAKELEELVRAGWFVSEAEIARQALVGFVRQQRYALQEQYQEEDIRWALSLRETAS